MPTAILSVLFFLSALLYSSVGHGGASGYLAVMGIVGVEPAMMKPTALCLNILVSAIAFWRFYSGKNFSWQIFLPLAVTAVPMAFIGGMIQADCGGSIGIFCPLFVQICQSFNR